jgi:hypothetical protein
MAAALSNGGLNFGTLASPVKDVHCSYAGTTQPYATPTYSCMWSQGAKEVKEQSGNWEIFEGKAARLSEGGEAGGPPTTNEEASSRVSAVYGKRAGGSAKCSRILAQEIEGHKLSMAQAHLWSCLSLNSYGDAIEWHEGELLREEWEWNTDGSVAKEHLDFTASTQELEEVSAQGTPAPEEKRPPAASTPAPSESTTTAACGALTYRSPHWSLGERWRVTNNGTSCSEAIRIIRDDFSGKASIHVGSDNAETYMTVNGWRCFGPETGSIDCTRGAQHITGSELRRTGGSGGE